MIRYLDFLPPLVFFPFSIKPFTGKVLKNIQACLNLICFVVQNPSITLVIVQSKLLLLLWKPHRLIHKIFSLTLYICFHFSNHLFEAEKLVNSSFTSRFTISIAFYWRRDPSEYTFALVHFPYHLRKVLLCDVFCSFPEKTPFTSFSYRLKYLEWLFFLLKSVQLIFDSPS